MPNLPVDVDSWGRSACYPRSTFYPLSDGPSMRNHRITKACFRTCSTCQSRSQARFCLYTLRLVSNQPERTFARLRYILGGDRPSQTTHQTVSLSPIRGRSEMTKWARVVFQGWLHRRWRADFKASHLSCTSTFGHHCQAIVKVHGVFPSCRGNTASSPRIQFH